MGLPQKDLDYFQLTYYFPRWLLIRRVVMLRLTMSTLGHPAASLTVSRIVPFDAEILSAATFGDTGLLQSLLQRRVASPFEVSLEGDSALIWAVEHDQKHVAKLLIEAGASPDAENMDGYSASDIAWTKILGKTSKDEEHFRTMFEVTDEFESVQFSVIPKIVLGLVKRDLREEFEVSTAAINILDAKGRTPLSWAVQRGDHDKARILLEYFANPNAFDPTGRSLYRWSVWPRDPTCTQLLIDIGADVNHNDIYGNTPLHYASWFNADPGHAKLMIQAEADINARSFEGNKPSPLHLACWHDHDATAAALIDAQAVLSPEDTINMLFLSIEESLPKTRALIPAKFDCSGTDMDGNTVLNAAVYLEEEHLEVLIDLDVPGLSPDIQNLDGFKPIELLEMRDDVNSRFKSTFRAFLNDIIQESRSSMAHSWTAGLVAPGGWIDG